MTEQVSTDSGAINDAPVASEVAQPVAQQEPVTEKLIPQSTLDKVVGSRVKEAYEKARRDAAAEYENKAQQTPPQTQHLGGIPQMDDAALEQRIMQAAHKMSTVAMANKIEQDFLAKIDAESKTDPEFKELYEAINIDKHPEMLLWTNELDNTASVIKDMAKNPTKFANILMLARSGSPMLAKMELQKLSQSIKTNAEAQQQKSADEPLDQLKPSTIGTDSGEMSVRDYMKIFRG